ncbi:uncharacterized protein C11orf52 homolog [Grammomys surdaster]|uniref:uncharacterized protein C11orf52 homolog n=1 Tax=Grammomys surdaster TaxID=491861 RepID=UPI0010A09B43|nr:uncharacterized protein C11orf52 homolog [Grammomys surdaster]
MSENQLGSLGDTSAMGNRLCCGGSWSCPSTFQKKNKTGSQARPTLNIVKQQQLWQNGTKDYETTAPTYEQVLHSPVSQEISPDFASEENDLHYADIHVLSQMRPYSLRKVKCLRSESATEYATLRFPQAAPQYDSNNGTLV